MTTMTQQSGQISTVHDHTNEIEIHLILFSGDGRLWLGCDSDGARSLPSIWIPKWTRVAQEAVKAGVISLGVEIFCLWEVREGEDFYLVARLKNWENGGVGLVGIPPENFSNAVQNEDVLRLATMAHSEAFAGTQASPSEPFKNIDWDIVLQRRLLLAVRPKGIELTGQIQQLNASETFALLRLDTTSSPLWFKAVGKPNLAEYSVTLGISDLFPGVIPPIISKFPEWNGWVTEDAGGKRLDSSTYLEDWKRATTRLADLQVSSLQYADDLFHIGCTDCRTHTLASHLELFVESMQRAMAEDQDLTTTRLDNNQINRVAEAVREAISETAILGIPDALVHRDLSGGNIQLSSTGCHFIDWAQACVASPFICSEYMKVHFASAVADQADSESQVAALSSAYASRWTTVLTPKQIRGALRYAPILAEYLYVTPMDGRTSLDLLRTRGSRAMMRSMVRRMWREMEVNSGIDRHESEAHYA